MSKSLEELDRETLKPKPPGSDGTRKKTISGHFNTLMGHIRRKSVPTTPVLGRSCQSVKAGEKGDAQGIRETFAVNDILFV